VYVSHIECSKCSARYEPGKILQLCGQCQSPVWVRYDLNAVAKAVDREKIRGRAASLWRYRELLPVRDDANIVSLGEGMTPLVPLGRIGKSIGLPNLLLKDEGIIPTGSFKARGAAVGVSMAKELGVKTLCMPTAGNAGGAWSAYAASAGLNSVILMPADAQEINKKECAVAGAKLYFVNGILNDAGVIAGKAVRKHGWYDASTLKEPYRIEGKKTMGLEIAEQMHWRVPDVIVYPTGGGVGIIAIHKALLELRELGWIAEKMPRLVAVQSSACAPIPKAWQEGKLESEYWQNPKTTIPGLRVPKALGDFLVLRAIYDTKGCGVAVSDEEAYAAQRQLARAEGCFICPEGAAALAAAAQLAKSNWIQPHESVVLLNTAAGLKYPETVGFNAPVLEKTDEIPDCSGEDRP